MSIEISNSLHAAGVVDSATGATPFFRANGAQGFASFGTDPAKNSVKTAPGRYKLRLVAPINLLAGDGIAWGQALTVGFFPDDHPGPREVFVTVDLADNFGVLDVQTQQDGEDADFSFSVVVLRLAQQATGS
jgi:hypothetical protein